MNVRYTINKFYYNGIKTDKSRILIYRFRTLTRILLHVEYNDIPRARNETLGISSYKFYCTAIIDIQIIKMSAESKIRY